MTIERFNCTYQNDFNDVYQADIDILPDGEFVRYEDHEEIVKDLERKIEQVTLSAYDAGWNDHWEMTN
jgi:hypothetical protein